MVELFLKYPDISEDRDIFHSRWVSGLDYFHFFRLSSDIAGHVPETEARMKKYSLSISLPVLCILVYYYKCHIGEIFA